MAQYATMAQMIESLLPRWRSVSRAERACIAVIVLALAIVPLLPSVAQDPVYHRFADRREWLGVPNAFNVLSNLAFVLVGIAGIAGLLSSARTRHSVATEASLWCIALGLLATSAGSTWYHVDPNDATLVWDRLPMTLAFAGILSAALAQRISERAARIALPLLPMLGIASVLYWHFSGDVAVYGVLQFGGFAALLVLVVATTNASDPFPWWWVIGSYAAAKVMEAADHAIWQASGGVVAGHAFKHFLAALAGAAALRPLRA